VALLRPERKGDVGAVLQVDVERVGAAFGQVVSRHVEDPDATAIAEGNVENIRVGSLVYVVNCASYRVQHGYRAVAARKHRRLVGDRVAVGVAYGEFHRNCAALLEHAGAVRINRWQNHLSRVRSGAVPILQPLTTLCCCWRNTSCHLRNQPNTRWIGALGTYGFLGLVKGHRHFPQYIPNALRSLRPLAAQIDNLQPLASFVAQV